MVDREQKMALFLFAVAVTYSDPPVIGRTQTSKRNEMSSSVSCLSAAALDTDR